MSRRVLAVVPDLFFATKIAATAKAVSVTLELVSLAGALDACAANPPDLLLLDLHAPGDPHSLVRALKADAHTAEVPVCGFFSHVEIQRRDGALAAGIDVALPRSAFVNRLPALLLHGLGA